MGFGELLCFFFFFKQKTAYEMRISDWSSDVCSSDLIPAARRRAGYVFQDGRLFPQMRVRANLLYGRHGDAPLPFDAVMDFLGIGHLLDRWPATLSGDRKSVV